MGIYSEIALAVKFDLVGELDQKFPWVREEADEVLTNDQGSLYHFELIKWHPSCVGDVKTLCDWLKDHEGEYRLVEACPGLAPLRSFVPPGRRILI